MRAGILLLFAGGICVLVMVGLMCVVRLAMPRSSASEWRERGVRLGMSEDELMRSFVDAEAGDWTKGWSCGGPSLEWTRRAAHAQTRWARFELHDGRLVALRIHSDQLLPDGRALETSAAVRQDIPYEDGTATTIVALGCPTHAAEAEQIARLVR
ncbi:MAG: hypothetical protein WBY94_21910 [Polyangiaceae bacterium]